MDYVRCVCVWLGRREWSLAYGGVCAVGGDWGVGRG